MPFKHILFWIISFGTVIESGTIQFQTGAQCTIAVHALRQTEENQAGTEPAFDLVLAICLLNDGAE